MVAFNNLSERYPELREAFEALEQWKSLHREERSYESRRISQWRPSLNHFNTSVALNVLVREGILKRFYTVRGPDGTLVVEGLFESPHKIPAVLHGMCGQEFNKNDGNLVTIYREVQE